MENDLLDVYDALEFLQSLSVCVFCKYWRTSDCNPSLEEDAMCSKKAKALDIIWNAIKEKPLETIISLSN